MTLGSVPATRTVPPEKVAVGVPMKLLPELVTVMLTTLPLTSRLATPVAPLESVTVGATLYVAVSYTHLDVYKRQALSVSGWTGALSHPQIVQRKLQQPEMRVFRVGEQWFGFWVMSDALDYRTSSATRLEPTLVPLEIQEKLGQLSTQLGLNFAAADFKTDPETGRLQFLEINRNPRFAGFDQAAGGVLCDAMLDWLLSLSLIHI